MMTDVLATVIGVVLGVLASIPVATLLARWSTRDHVLDVPYSEPQETSVIVV